MGGLVEQVRATGRGRAVGDGGGVVVAAGHEPRSTASCRRPSPTRSSTRRPRRITVDIDLRQDRITVDVRDDGVGVCSPAATPGMGLAGMRERVAVHGGTVSAGPDPAGGWRVHALLPLTVGPLTLGSTSAPGVETEHAQWHPVLLVDDQALIRVGFRMILEETDDIDVVGEAPDGAEAVRLAGELAPDVVLMDVRMPGVDGIEATRQIVARDQDARVLVLTTFDLDDYAIAALRAGASGFVLKDVPVDELARAIRAVASGDAVVSQRITRLLLDEYGAPVTRPDRRRPDRMPALDQLTRASAPCSSR